jgi:hypothetical protein
LDNFLLIATVCYMKSTSTHITNIYTFLVYLLTYLSIAISEREIRISLKVIHEDYTGIDLKNHYKYYCGNDKKFFILSKIRLIDIK